MVANGKQRLKAHRTGGLKCRNHRHNSELASIHGRLVRKKQALGSSSVPAQKIKISTRAGYDSQPAVAALIASLLSQAGPEARKTVAAALAAPTRDGLDSELWGDAPTGQQSAAGQLDNLRKQFESRRALEQSSLTRIEVATLLGTSQQAVTDMLAAHHLVGLKQGRRWFIPSWQLDVESERGVIPGLNKLDSAFPGGVVALSEWVNRPSADLGDRTPRQLLVANDTDAVVQLATQLTSAGW
jgi:hypothetical protein